MNQLDADQVENYFDESLIHLQSVYTLAGRSFKHVVSRLDALLLVLKSCKGSSCTDPWSTLHPEGNIKNLKDALAERFDAFYHNQPKISFSACALGYIKEVEGPQDAHVWKDNNGKTELRKQSFEYGGHWSLWT